MRAFRLDLPQQWASYSPIIVTPEALARHASSSSVRNRVRTISESLEPDEWTRYIARVYEKGLALLGDEWIYQDLLSILYAVAEVGQPESYLEIGVRRGRSMAMVVSASPRVNVVGFDVWQEGYAGSENPGADFVLGELKRLGHAGQAEFVDGDSHTTVPEYFRIHPDAAFDLVTVDGDHSLAGARADLETVVPHLNLGGVLVFDDTVNPYCPGLDGVWTEFLKDHGELRGYSFDDLGTGVAFAVKMWPDDASVPKASPKGPGFLSRFRAKGFSGR